MKDIELFNDHFQNFKAYGIPKAQLIIADVPYNLGANAYASNPAWYVDGDNKNGESALAGKQFFDTDKDFRPAEFMHFCSQMLRKDKPIKEEKSEGGGRSKGGAACMILFCPFEQMHYYIELGQRYGLKRYIPLVFRKDFSAQVLKANMKVVGNCEYGLILYRDRLPKFNNDGRMTSGKDSKNVCVFSNRTERSSSNGMSSRYPPRGSSRSSDKSPYSDIRPAKAAKRYGCVS